MEDHAVRTITLLDLEAGDSASATMVLVTKNTHDPRPVPLPPINEVPEGQAAVEADLPKDLFKLGVENP